MGVSSLFCCFRNMPHNIVALTGLGAGVLSFAFMIWGLADIFFERKGVQAIYIIAFILICLCLVGFIGLLIFLLLGSNNRAINNLARIFCLVIIIMCGLAFIFILISWIILIVDYIDLNKELEAGEKISSHDWAAVFVPSIITLIALPVMALVANYLYKVFTDKLNTGVYPINVNSTTVPTIPNLTQPGIFPNNNGPVPPMVNNVASPVPIQQSGMNLNK